MKKKSQKGQREKEVKTDIKRSGLRLRQWSWREKNKHNTGLEMERDEVMMRRGFEQQKTEGEKIDKYITTRDMEGCRGRGAELERLRREKRSERKEQKKQREGQRRGGGETEEERREVCVAEKWGVNND